MYTAPHHADCIASRFGVFEKVRYSWLKQQEVQSVVDRSSLTGLEPKFLNMISDHK